MDADDFPLTLGAAYFANESDVSLFMEGLPPYKPEVS